jgi:hypothetical protein
MEKLVQIEPDPAVQPVRDGTREVRGQDRERLARAGCVLESGARRLACGMIPQAEDGGFRDGPRERGMAHFCARSPVACASRGLGTRDQAAVGDKILDAGETRDGMDRIPPHEAQEFANAGHRMEQVDRLGLVRLRRVDDGSLQVAEALIVGVDQRQISGQALLDRRVGKPLRDARTVGFGGQLFPDLRQVVLAIRLLDVAQPLRPLPGARPAASEQVAGGAHLCGIDLRLREHPAPEQDGHVVRLHRSVVGLAAVERLHVERVPEHKRHLLTRAEVSEPGPGQETLDGHDDLGAIRQTRPEECLWTGLHVLMAQDLPSLIQDADIQAAGMQVDAAIQLVWLGVESPEVSSS